MCGIAAPKYPSSNKKKTKKCELIQHGNKVPIMSSMERMICIWYETYRYDNKNVTRSTPTHMLCRPFDIDYVNSQRRLLFTDVKKDPFSIILWICIIISLRPIQNGCHFTNYIIRCIFVNENGCISIDISLKFAPKGLINNISVSEPMMVNSPTHICVNRPQWVQLFYLLVLFLFLSMSILHKVKM